MSDLTQGKWIYHPPSELDVMEDYEDYRIHSIQGKERHYIGTISREEDARLIAAAPELYRLLVSYWQDEEEFGILNEQRHRKVSELFYRIDGLEDGHE